MTATVCVPIAFAFADLYQTNVPETDHAAWNSGTTYGIGNRVISTTTHLIYQSVAAGNLNKDPTVDANIGVWWVEVGFTNRWRPFDKSQAQAAVKTSGDIAYRMLLSAPIDTVTLMDVSGGDVAVEVIHPDTVRSNFVTYSEELDDPYWTRTRTNLGNNIARDPWGSFQAESLVEDSSTGTHFIDAGSYNFTNGVQYSLQARAKRGVGSRDLRLYFPASAFPGDPRGLFDLNAGTIVGVAGATGTIEADDNGYWVCTITATADATASGFAGRLMMMQGVTESYTGDNSSSIYLTGVQLSIGAAPDKDDYQWIRDAATFGKRTVWQQSTLSSGTGDAVTTLTFRGVDAQIGDYLGVAIYKADGINTTVSEIVAGVSFGIGELVAPFSSEGIDFSGYERNTFGRAKPVRRGYAKRGFYNFYFDSDDRGGLEEFLIFVRGTPMLVYDANNLNNSRGRTIFGFIRRFDLPDINAPIIIGTMEVEGSG